MVKNLNKKEVVKLHIWYSRATADFDIDCLCARLTTLSCVLSSDEKSTS